MPIVNRHQFRFKLKRTKFRLLTHSPLSLPPHSPSQLGMGHTKLSRLDKLLTSQLPGQPVQAAGSK